MLFTRKGTPLAMKLAINKDKKMVIKLESNLQPEGKLWY